MYLCIVYCVDKKIYVFFICAHVILYFYYPLQAFLVIYVILNTTNVTRIHVSMVDNVLITLEVSRANVVKVIKERGVT